MELHQRPRADQSWGQVWLPDSGGWPTLDIWEGGFPPRGLPGATQDAGRPGGWPGSQGLQEARHLAQGHIRFSLADQTFLCLHFAGHTRPMTRYLLSPPFHRNTLSTGSWTVHDDRPSTVTGKGRSRRRAAVGRGGSAGRDQAASHCLFAFKTTLQLGQKPSPREGKLFLRLGGGQW